MEENLSEEEPKEEKLSHDEHMELDSIFFRDKKANIDAEGVKSSLSGQSYENVDHKKLMEFLKKIEERLALVSNQDVARLLAALIEKGLSIEDDEELEYWINRLEHEAMMRILDYLNTFYMSDSDKNGNVRFSKHKKRHVKKTKEYDLKDVDAFTHMIGSIKNVERKRNPLSREYDESSKEQVAEYQRFLKLEKYYSEIERVLKQDLVEKRVEEANKNNENSNDDTSNQQTDYLKMLKNKMENANVSSGGEYWNDVLSDYSSSGDKESFAKNWSADARRISAEAAQSNESSDKAKIESLRGVDNSSTREDSSSNQNSNSNSQSSSSSGRSGGATSSGNSGGR